MIEPQFGRAVEPDRAMRRGKDQSAAGQMDAHDFAQAFLSCGVKRAGRLVEQPDRTFDGKEPRDRKAAALPGGEIRGRQVGERIKPNRRQRSTDIGGIRAEKARPKSQIFSDRERGLQRVLMPEVVGLLADRQFRIATFQSEAAAGDAEEPRDHAQER